MVEQKLTQNEQQIRQIDTRLDKISDEIHENQYDLRKQNERQDQLTRDADQRQAVKERLEQKIQMTNDQWTSKHMWIRSAANAVGRLEDEVQQIKSESRQATERRQNYEYNRDELDRDRQRRNYATNQRK